MTAPPLAALHQATANVLRVKSGWPFAFGQLTVNEATAKVQSYVYTSCDTILERAKQTGAIRADADLGWARQVYLALVAESAHGMSGGDGDPDALATRIIETLLFGVGDRDSAASPVWTTYGMPAANRSGGLEDCPRVERMGPPRRGAPAGTELHPPTP